MKHWSILALLAALILLVCSAQAEGAFTIAAEGDIRGYEENVVLATSGVEGEITFSLEADGRVYREWSAGHVPAGETALVWDGLAAWEERLDDGAYTLKAVLHAADGSSAVAETPVQVVRCRQALLFALPCRDTLYLGGDEKWFAEVCMVRDGTVVMEVSAASEPDTVLATRRKDVGSDPEKFYWDGCVGDQPLPAGDYMLRFYAADHPAYVRTMTVTLSDMPALQLPLAVTGSLIPAEDASDAEIWAMMQQPAVLVDLKATGQQEVYAAPDRHSTVLGTLRGSSQAVEVMELCEEGWARIGAWNHESGAYITGYVPQDKLRVTMPASAYGLLLNKAEQTLTVFREGERLGSISVSTGLMTRDELDRETPAGSFLTLEHEGKFVSEGFQYAYGIRYDGGNLLHQVGYRVRGGRKDYDEQTAVLGQKASQGNIRLPHWSVGNTFNAYWLWTNLPYHTRLIVLDDPQRREMEEAAANAGRVWQPELLPTAASPTDLAEGETEVVLTLGGDAVLGTRETWQTLPEALPAVLEAQGMAYPFSGLQEIFAADDMTLINLECVLKENRAGEDKDKLYRFRGLPGYTQALLDGSVEQVNIANNHYIDYGEKGKTATREALTAAGIPFSGHGYTWVWEIDGRRIGFGGCRETTYKRDRGVISRDIAALRDDGCDVIIYSCHWGKEYSAGHNELQETMARAAADAGADIVVGTHPHVVQGVDTVDGTLVLYSLGNLMFGGTHDMTTFDAVVARLRLRFGAEGYRGCALELIPIMTSGSAPRNDFRPVLAEGEDRHRILLKIQADSGLLLSDVMWFPPKGRCPFGNPT